MNFSENAIQVLSRRYFIKDEAGNPIEDTEGLLRRVADTIAKVEGQYGGSEEDIRALSDRFFDRMASLDFLPNSPTLMNAGRPLGQLSACFVLPVKDTMEDIFEAIKQAALIHKSGGGTGFSFSRLRRKGATVNSTGGVASGPVSFMRVFNMATEAVKQGGTRRGANMGVLRADHPDILEFIDCKRNNADITNFNISVGITEAFMEAAQRGEEYDLIDPATGESTGRLNAKEVFEKIIHAAWQNGEPGILFLDRLQRDNPVPGQGEIEATNPCGEQPLMPYESCNLGSINLSNMLRGEPGNYEIDWDKLRETVHDGVYFLDHVIDVNAYPLPLIAETTRKTRKIGLGVMGFADMLLRLGIPYNSEEGVKTAEEVMAFIREEARQKSEELGASRGSFPLHAESIFADRPMRNGTVTTIAPTGTLSILAGCSSGVEPVFSYVFYRNVMDGTKLPEINPILKEELIRRGLYSEELMQKISETGTIAHLTELPEDLRRVFVCAHDISPEYHIRMQAAFQQHTDNAVSKTVNLPSEATPEDVREVFLLAYKLGCKGVTIYRDGSREGQVLNAGKQERAAQPAQPQSIVPRPRPDRTAGVTERMKIGCGNLYITVNYDEQGICEVFTNTGRTGGCPSQSEATARLISIALRSGISASSIIEQLKGIRCPSTIRQNGMKCTSCPDAIARVIEQLVKNQGIGAKSELSGAAQPEGSTPIQPVSQVQPGQTRFCPECGAKVEHEGGCITCRSCGYSKCG